MGLATLDFIIPGCLAESSQDYICISGAMPSQASGTCNQPEMVYVISCSTVRHTTLREDSTVVAWSYRRKPSITHTIASDPRPIERSIILESEFTPIISQSIVAPKSLPS